MSVLRRRIHGRPLGVGLAAVALAFAWQALTVHYNRGGNWTALFCTGGTQRTPLSLAWERIYLFPDAAGYDRQFYHYVAHDPLGRSGLSGYIDAARLRYSRILVPGLAHLLAAGRARWIDAAYFAVVLWFVYLGAYWLSRFAEMHDHHPAFGLLFLASPAALVSIDRMTVDVALAAFWIAALVYWRRGSERPLFLVMALAPLVRKTGLMLAAAYCLWAVSRRAFAKAALAAVVSTAPFALWQVYTRSNFPPYTTGWLASNAFRGVIDAVVGTISHPGATPLTVIAGYVHLFGLAGSLLAIALAFRFRMEGAPVGLMEAGLIASGALGLVLALIGPTDVWVHVYGHGRLLSPLLILLTLRGWSKRALSDLVPIGLVLAGVGLQLTGDALRVVRGLMGMVAG